MLRIAICDDEKIFLKQENELIAKILDESNNEYEIKNIQVERSY